MASDEKKPTRAELAEAVSELKDEVAALRADQAAHGCHGHGCGHAHCNWGHCGCWVIHSYYPSPLPGCAPYYPTWTVSSGSVSSNGISISAETSVAAGVPQVVTLSFAG